MSPRWWTPGSAADMLYLLHDQLWWPGMATQMQKTVSNCEQCIQHEGTHAEAPMWPIIVTAPLELLHMLTLPAYETTMELEQTPNVVNLLVFCEQFTKHVMAYDEPNQTVKTFAKFLWQGYILIFRSIGQAPEQLRSQLWKQHHQRALWAYGHAWEVRTSPYAQTNRHILPNIMTHMIGKLSKDQNGLAEAFILIGACLQLYYISHHQIPQYLMFKTLHLPINFYFPISKGHEKTPACWPLCCWVMWMAVGSL